MPAPSPDLPSASTAPLCQTALRDCIPYSTTSLFFLASSEVISPTPQASCSKDEL